MYGPSLLPNPAVTLDPSTGMGDPTKLIDAAKSLRDRVASVYDESVAYTLPGKPGINMSANQLPIYDSTAVEGMADCTSRIVEGIIPAYSRWTSLLAGLEVPDDQKGDVQAQLEIVDTLIFENVQASNFSLEAGESVQDAIIGTGGLDISEGAGRSAFQCRAIPHGCLLFLIGPDGMPDPIWEVRRGSPYHAKILFPGAAMPSITTQTPAEVDYIECWQRDWSKPNQFEYRRTVWVDGKPNELLLDERHEGEGACPKIVFRWSKGSGEGWGRGPGVRLLPDIRKVNFAEQCLLDHAEVALAGIWTYEDDGVLNPATARMEPGAMLPVAMGSGGLKNVAPGANFDIASFVLSEARANINRGFYTDALGDPNKSPRKAAEVDARMGELARRIGTPMVRLIVEFVMPSVARMVRILKDRGLVRMPAIDGKVIKLLPTSPLAQAQRFEDIDNMLNYGRALNEIFPQGQGIGLMIAEDRFGDELALKMQVPRRILRTPDERASVAQTGLDLATGGGGADGADGAGAGGGDGMAELPPPAPDGFSPAA